MILISIYNHIYEVSGFISKHPGEGISDTYLRTYRNKECTEDFERFHFTNEADEMLINAREEKYDEETKIYYVCPWFFKKKIPSYFHFLPNDKYGIKYMEDKDDNTFILRPSNSDLEKSLSLTYKNDEGEIYQLKIRKTEDNIWYTIFEDDEGEAIDVEDKYIENIVTKIMIDNDYTGV